MRRGCAASMSRTSIVLPPACRRSAAISARAAGPCSVAVPRRNAPAIERPPHADRWGRRSCIGPEQASALGPIGGSWCLTSVAGALIGALAYATLSYPLLIPPTLPTFVLLGRP